jgi:hypothetical protein
MNEDLKKFIEFCENSGYKVVLDENQKIETISGKFNENSSLYIHYGNPTLSVWKNSSIKENEYLEYNESTKKIKLCELIPIPEYYKDNKNYVYKEEDKNLFISRIVREFFQTMELETLEKNNKFIRRETLVGVHKDGSLSGIRYPNIFSWDWFIKK